MGAEEGEDEEKTRQREKEGTKRGMRRREMCRERAEKEPGAAECVIKFNLQPS